ncbi:MAG: hypothetical protein K9N09_10140 [Candidatus Cloacimonetes bacterium]|nr:hypothetical protein [Candidatus Cloacimonadota bacterium]MCF7814513.1 hypothetical protein [Candidatus Cloacimonadota bacterium]MCF7869052.1 hypothetical protein [Candidatus Cloacimonadota bacterium]MCF7884447.1 hypothetical protein [Candidatus Cloacimonadota bacterium]
MLKRINVVFWGLLYLHFNLLVGLDVPYSPKPVRNQDNLLKDFYRVSPPDSAEIELETKAWLWHDDKNLYLHFESEIDENLVYGRFADKDVNPYSDYLRVQLITDLDNYFAYGYFAYPLGSKYDFIRNTELESDKYWNSTYSYSSKIDDHLWKVTFKIPFSDLRHDGSAPYNWKIILTRYQKNSRQSYSTPFVLTKMGIDYFRKAHSIHINRNIPNSRMFRIKPHAIFTYDIKNNEVNFDEENVGLDLTFNLNPRMRTKLSLSPDFSDVPMDAVIDSYNSKYAPTFSENRYFFIEDFNVLGTNNQLFYTRNIVQPVYALKFSSNYKNLDFGFLSAKDKLEKETCYDASDDSTYTVITNPDDFYNILAFKPVWDKFRCQFTILNRVNDNYSNTVLHTNPIWEAGKNQYFWAEVNFSNKQMNGNSDYGYHFQTGFSRYSRHEMLKFSIQQMSSEYTLDMGKIYEDDFYGWNFDFANLHDFDSDILSDIEHSLTLSEEYDNISTNLLERYLTLESEIATNFNADIELEFVYVKENIEPDSKSGKFTDKTRFGVRLEWDKLSWFIQRLSLNKVDYYFYSLDDSYQGDIIQYNAIGTLFRHFSYSLNIDYSNYPDIPDLPFIDSEYVIGNFDSTINFSNTISFTLGIRYHNYERYDQTFYFGYYSNFKWELNSKFHYYMGLNSEMNEIENKIEKNYEKFYTKITYIF